MLLIDLKFLIYACFNEGIFTVPSYLLCKLFSLFTYITFHGQTEVVY